MDLRQNLLRALDHYDCRPFHLAQAAGVANCIVSRIKAGKQTGCLSTTLSALMPFLRCEAPKDLVDKYKYVPKKMRVRPQSHNEVVVTQTT